MFNFLSEVKGSKGWTQESNLKKLNKYKDTEKKNLGKLLIFSLKFVEAGRSHAFLYVKFRSEMINI